MYRRRLLGFSTMVLAWSPSLALRAQVTKKPFTPEQLDQLLAPVALYPDALLAQTLMAATYPLEIVEARRGPIPTSRATRPSPPSRTRIGMSA